MTDAKPNALDMLKLAPDEFMVEVSKVMSEKPWRHCFRETIQGPLRCAHCKEHRTKGAFITGCPVPPRLTEPPEWWAFKLRDEAVQKVGGRIATVVDELWTSLGRPGYQEHGRLPDDWLSYFASPFEQIAVCCIALGYWSI